MNDAINRAVNESRRRILAVCLPAFLLCASLSASAQNAAPADIALSREAPVKLLGKLKGTQRESQDYVVHLEAGDTLQVSLQSSDDASTYFNVLPPGSETALYVGTIQGESRWTHEAEQAGDYTVRVYLVRAAARQGKSSRYTLTLTRE